LQNKPGELDALRNASEQTWERLTPVVHFVGQKRTERLSAEAVREQVRKVASAVGSHTVYLDVMRLRPTLPVATTSGDVPLLQQIYAQARKRRMCFVPVACAGESNEEHLRLIADAAVQDGHGVAIRYKMRSIILSSGLSVGDYLGGVIQDVGIPVERADLLIDLEYLDGDAEVDGEDVARHVTETLAAGPWRSVVLLGSSMPRMMGGIKEGTVGALPRREWEVWTQLREESLTRMPAFGDYAVQSPQPPNGGGPGMRANIRYTTASETLIARGLGSVMQEGNEQYRELCQWLVARPEFSGRRYSWGDGVIDACATGQIPAGAQNMWRGAGTSHHLQFVIDQLRPQQAEP
jgi:hypothetical protein